MDQTGMQLRGFSSKLLWVISCTNTSLFLLFPAQLENLWPEPGALHPLPITVTIQEPSLGFIPVLGGRETGGEKFLQGQQIPPRISKPLGFIPKQNKISLIFHQAGGEACLPTFPELDSHTPPSHRSQGKRTPAESRGRGWKGRKIGSRKQEFLPHSSNLIPPRAAGPVSVAPGSVSGRAAPVPAAPEAGEGSCLMALILALAI